MIEGHIESLSPGGIIDGWVRDSGSARPCHVQVLWNGRIIAEAMGDRFRPDLLARRLGHGHYGFQARLREKLPPGPCGVVMYLPRTGISAGMGLTVPILAKTPKVTVEALLLMQAEWRPADLLAVPDCLDMERNLARMGAPRFVDGVYRFVLGRWPSKAEAGLNTESLAAGRITASGLLVELLQSRERADMDAPLPSPFDTEFPFE
jgi:hypothetical protein